MQVLKTIQSSGKFITFPCRVSSIDESRPFPPPPPLNGVVGASIKSEHKLFKFQVTRARLEEMESIPLLSFFSRYFRGLRTTFSTLLSLCPNSCWDNAISHLS